MSSSFSEDLPVVYLSSESREFTDRIESCSSSNVPLILGDAAAVSTIAASLEDYVVEQVCVSLGGPEHESSTHALCSAAGDIIGAQDSTITVDVELGSAAVLDGHYDPDCQQTRSGVNSGGARTLGDNIPVSVDCDASTAIASDICCFPGDDQSHEDNILQREFDPTKSSHHALSSSCAHFSPTSQDTVLTQMSNVLPSSTSPLQLPALSTLRVSLAEYDEQTSLPPDAVYSTAATRMSADCPPDYSQSQRVVPAEFVLPTRAYQCRLCAFISTDTDGERMVLEHLVSSHGEYFCRTAAVDSSNESTGREDTERQESPPLSTKAADGDNPSAGHLSAHCVQDRHGRVRLVRGLPTSVSGTMSSAAVASFDFSSSIALSALPNLADSSKCVGPQSAVSPPADLPASTVVGTSDVTTDVIQSKAPLDSDGVCGAILTRKTRGRPAGSRSLGLSSLPRAPTVSELRECGLVPCARPGCGVRLPSDDLMRIHERCHQCSSNPTRHNFSCFLCGHASDQWLPLALHLWRGHSLDVGLYRCHMCEYRTTSYSRLMRQHLPTHGRRRPFKCQQCTRSFKNAKQLANHGARVHRTGGRVIAQSQRQDCDQPASVSAGDASGKVPETDAVRRTLLCAFCGAKFGCRSSLSLHTHSRHGGRRLQCSQCAFVTADHNTLRRHLMRHSGERPYRCEHCQYTCIQAGTYKRHLRVKHPNIAAKIMHSCKLCSFDSLQQSALFRHMKSVHGICSSSSSSPSVLSPARISSDVQFCEPSSSLNESEIS